MCWYSMLVLHCNVGENVGILNQDCLVSKRIPARTTCHIGECYFPRKNSPGRDATCYELWHATQLSGPPVVLGAVLTLQDDNNGTGNDIDIERNRYHDKDKDSGIGKDKTQTKKMTDNTVKGKEKDTGKDNGIERNRYQGKELVV